MVATRRYDYNTGLGWNEKYVFNDPLNMQIHTFNSNLLDLPEEILSTILSYFDFETIGNLRLVCRRFNRTCHYILNAEYTKLQTKVRQSYDYMSQLPREIPMKYDQQLITLLSAELDRLHFIFKIHVEKNCCCFFAGSFLDEAYTIFKAAKSNVILKSSRSCNELDSFVIMNKLFILHNKLLDYLPYCYHYRKSVWNHPAVLYRREA